MNYNLYCAIYNFYQVKSQYKLASNVLRVAYGFIHPRQMIYDASKDAVIKHILFG